MPYGNTSNIIQGPAKIYVDDGLGGGYAAVGLTQNDLMVSFEPQWGEIIAHQLGKRPVDYRYEGGTAKIKFDCLERTNTNLKLAVPTAVTSVVTGEAVSFGTQIGTKLSDKVVKIKVHPMNTRGAGGADDETYLTDDYTFWKCASMSNFEDNLNGDSDRVYPVELVAIPDLTKAAAQNLFIKGDPADASIDSTPPTVSSVKAEKTNVLTAITAADLADVDGDTEIEIVFSEFVKEVQLIQPYVALIKDSDKTVVACTYDYTESTKTLMITPGAALTASAKYHVLVSAIQDLAGNILAGPHMRTFTVAA
jgi:hypothetical protein